ncbi:unnamed protein product [Microthlaspi erraticum]|uniref:F-box associated beta-propeller type 1 domain-containing protein n=1 Tax=Microthlaspi erraticum TaxID=1685480 RepID=A0A6D2HJ89_9BRAS|nr:unnamed protein product [Microthlaspi erraticum]
MASSSRLCAKGSSTLPLELVEEEILHRVPTESSQKLAVWNPALSSQVKWVEPSHAHKHNGIYGFGYDSDNKYKVLRFNRGREMEYEIYDLKSKLWTSFPATFDWSPIKPIQNVSMKGNMYWIAKSDKTRKTFIQSFDFSTETFKPICSSNPVEARVVGVYQNNMMNHHDMIRFVELDIVVLSDFGGDRLSLLHQHRDKVSTREIKIEVWVTNKVTDSVVSWTKYFTHSHLPILLDDNFSLRHPSYFIHKTNGIMLWCDRVLQDEDGIVRASFYEIGEGEIKKVEIGPRFSSNGENNLCIGGSTYVPSLVPVP